MTLGKPHADLFYCLETSLHRPEVRRSPQQTAGLLADEFVEFAKSGRVYNKEVTIDALANEGSSGSSMVPQVADFFVTALSNDVVLVRYRSVRAAPDGHKTFETLRSSIWKSNLGRWQMVFHQGTPIPHE
ncbi:hypothetical protein ABID21_005026 [Pseudorhizobium tarimense]|uniref:DUF4440 domain-containing protein n=1 Tax=Pseudorhizobium tarimense TaxID=1079109 RepID=A0ABV2HEA7_9HYPH